MTQRDNMFAINLSAVINSHTAWPINKMLAHKVAFQTNFAIGDFFKSLGNEDIRFLSEAIATTNMQDHASNELFLMMTLLSMAEGLSLEEGDEDLIRRFESLIMLITCDALARDGFAKISYENMSLGYDMRMAKLIEATPAGQALIAQLLGGADNAG